MMAPASGPPGVPCVPTPRSSMSEDRRRSRRHLAARVATAPVRGPWWLLRRVRALLGPGDAARQSLVALALNASTSLVAGIVLGAITGTLERLPGLLILVPGAIGLRGNIFSTFGNRLSTAIHAGRFELTARRDGILMQNVLASLALTAGMAVALAALAKAFALAIGIPGTVSLLTLVFVSVVGGLLASIVVLAASVALAWGAVRRGWDLDNVVAPVVSTLGDVLTLPALWLATLVVDTAFVVPVGGSVLGVLSIGGFAYSLFARGPLLRQVTRQSWPILTLAAGLSTLAGLVLEQRIVSLALFPALLVLQPAFVSSAGALGGILSSRLATKLHLGFVAPTATPQDEARLDGISLLLIGFPVYVFNAVGAHFAAGAFGLASPGLGAMLAISLLAGLTTVLFVIGVAYYSTVGAVLLRLDPDTYGIPVVTSSVDFLGSATLLGAAALLGLLP